jgi:protein ImuB
MLWIALHLPLLSLESFVATLPGGAAKQQPVALMDAQRIVCANAAAQALGVKTGLKRATALALAPQLTLGQADPARDRLAITGVAHAALAFTPSVTLEPWGDASTAPHTVLLEVQASLRYFGGRAKLLQCLRAAMAPLGHQVVCASALTAQGAALLSRLDDAPQGLHAADLPSLGCLLHGAPVWLLEAGREHWDVLQGMGLRTCADLQRLPRSGVARRFGETLLDEFDRALGNRPDPRRWITLPDTFSSRLELFARADTTEQVLHGASLLLVRLMAWASAQHAQVRRFTLQMQHEARHRHDVQTPPDSTLDIALAEPSSDIAHLRLLLRERLAHLQLPAPTLELQLHCSDIARRAPPNQELFATTQSEREGLVRLIERLQARLGGEQVQRLSRIEDHRPERSSALHANPAAALEAGPARGRATASAAAQAMPAPRPVWLLPQPEALPERQFRPLLDGRALHLLCGPERIESGWWDAALAERDYFIAQASDGALVWIYRARLPLSAAAEGQGWFLQGRFG